MKPKWSQLDTKMKQQGAQMNEHSKKKINKWLKIRPTEHQNGSKMEPKWSQLGTKMEQNGAKMGQTLEKIGSKKQRNKKRGGTPQRCFILAEKVANMAPSWAPKSIKNR